METTMVIWMAAVAVLLVVVVVLGILLARGRSRARRRMSELEVRNATRAAEREREHEASVSALAGAHEGRIETIAQEHERELSRMRGEVSAALEAARSTRNELAKGLKWEAASRRMILRVCDELGLRGSLHTNVTFMPADAFETRSYVSQVDHVLLLDGARLVIENKRWRGVVFDGVRPSEVHPAFGRLVDESRLGDRFSVQMTVDIHSPQSISVVTHTGDAAPASQVRRQARRLSEYVEQQTGEKLWFDTCVLYSHHDAEVHAAPKDQTTAGAATRVVAGADGLTEAIRAFASRRGGADAERTNALLFDALSDLGADSVRFGADPGDAEGA